MTAPSRLYDRLRDTSHRAELIRRALPSSPGSAVEFGPGSGWLISLLLAEGWEVTAYEADEERAAELRRQYPRAEIHGRPVGGHELRSLSAPHDAAFALSLLHHLEDPRTGFYGLLEASPLVVVETPSRSEALSPEIAGGLEVSVLHDIVMHNWPAVLGYSPSAYVPGALRPLAAFDKDLSVGTVTSGAGWTSRQWPEVGALVARRVRRDLHPGSLNLELDRALEPPSITVDTAYGPVGVAPYSVAGVEAFALFMPDSDRRRLFAEFASTENLREVLQLKDGDRLPLRPRGRL